LQLHKVEKLSLMLFECLFGALYEDLIFLEGYFCMTLYFMGVKYWSLINRSRNIVLFEFCRRKETLFILSYLSYFWRFFLLDTYHLYTWNQGNYNWLDKISFTFSVQLYWNLESKFLLLQSVVLLYLEWSKWTSVGLTF